MIRWIARGLAGKKPISESERGRKNAVAMLAGSRESDNEVLRWWAAAHEDLELGRDKDYAAAVIEVIRPEWERITKHKHPYRTEKLAQKA